MTNEKAAPRGIEETIALLGGDLCIEAYTYHSISGDGGNSIGCEFEAAMIDAIEDSGYPLREGHLSHGGATLWGDRLIDAGRWIWETSGR